jgi:exosortase
MEATVATAPERPSDAARSRAMTSSSRWLLSFVAIELVLLFAPTAKWLLDRWTMGIWYNGHGLFIPPLVAYFSWITLRKLKAAPVDVSPWGFLFLAPALAALALDAGIHSQILSAIALVIALPGLSLLFLGATRTRAIAFPLAFSFFMLPIPLAVTEHMHFVLRQIGTAGSAAVLPAIGIRVFAEGTNLHLANATLFVGDGCSGFSTLYASLAMAALTAYACNYMRGRIQTLVLAAPIAIASNIVRIVILAVLVHRMGLGVLDTWMHPASGMLTFAISLPLIFWIGSPRPEPATS